MVLVDIWLSWAIFDFPPPAYTFGFGSEVNPTLAFIQEGKYCRYAFLDDSIFFHGSIKTQIKKVGC